MLVGGRVPFLLTCHLWEGICGKISFLSKAPVSRHGELGFKVALRARKALRHVRTTSVGIEGVVQIHATPDLPPPKKKRQQQNNMNIAKHKTTTTNFKTSGERLSIDLEVSRSRPEAPFMLFFLPHGDMVPIILLVHSSGSLQGGLHASDARQPKND